MADALAGTAVAGLSLSQNYGLVAKLAVISAFLYAGGIVFNDIFDRKLDATERPERPIPSGQVPLYHAYLYGIVLLLTAVAMAFSVGTLTGMFSVGIVFFAVAYDRFAKHHAVFGPIFMGMARALNLLMGISVVVPALHSYWWLGFLPLVFIASVTLTSREENRGRNKGALGIAIFLDVIVALVIGYLIYVTTIYWYIAGALALLWVIGVLRAKIRAFRVNTPENIKNAVKTGVLSLIVLDACYALVFDQFSFALLILILLPLSLALARKFAVT
jgi:4-hydroxybenzoate polyprenyltransferase